MGLAGAGFGGGDGSRRRVGVEGGVIVLAGVEFVVAVETVAGEETLTRVEAVVGVETVIGLAVAAVVAFKRALLVSSFRVASWSGVGSRSVAWLFAFCAAVRRESK